MKKLCLLAFVAGLPGSQVLAADLYSPPPAPSPAASPLSETDWSSLHGFISLGGGVAPKYEGSKKYQAIPLGFFAVNYGNFTVKSSGLGISAAYTYGNFLTFGPIIQYHGQRDSIPSLGLDKVKSTVDVGGFVGVGWKDLMLAHDKLSGEVKFLGDAGGVYKGYTIEPSISYSVPVLPNAIVTASLKTTYADDHYMRTYFSSSPFQAKAGIKDVGGTLSGTYFFDKSWGLTVLGGYSRLVGSAADSPIVKSNNGSPNQFLAGAAITYKF
ncbi:MAG: MipA/OmpV family protein [Bradyrhizobium sp.]|nr:MipA/OmpV family protein [Bradyrhizobium sp.]